MNARRDLSRSGDLLTVGRRFGGLLLRLKGWEQSGTILSAHLVATSVVGSVASRFTIRCQRPVFALMQLRVLYLGGAWPQQSEESAHNLARGQRATGAGAQRRHPWMDRCARTADFGSRALSNAPTRQPAGQSARILLDSAGNQILLRANSSGGSGSQRAADRSRAAVASRSQRLSVLRGGAVDICTAVAKQRRHTSGQPGGSGCRPSLSAFAGTSGELIREGRSTTHTTPPLDVREDCRPVTLRAAPTSGMSAPLSRVAQDQEWAMIRRPAALGGEHRRTGPLRSRIRREPRRRVRRAKEPGSGDRPVCEKISMAVQPRRTTLNCLDVRV